MRSGGTAADDDRQKLRHERVYGVLSHDGCRQVLAALVAAGGELTRSELVCTLARPEPTPLSGPARHERRLLLSHLYLPKLEQAGLVHIADDHVRTTLDHADLPPDIHSFIYRDRTALAHCLRVLSVGPRRAVVEQLAATAGELRLEELARLLLTTAADDGSTVDSLSTVDTLAVTLHHLHLPALERAGLVRYDPVRKRVSSTQGDDVDDVTMSGVSWN